VKLLLDQNLSRRLIGELQTLFPGSVHVSEVGLETASDLDVWTFARDNGFTIVSKDGDFRTLAILMPASPKVIWLRIGNATSSVAFALLSESAAAIERFEESEVETLLVLPSYTERTVETSDD
jgi:predicted nuclease of predicted toxin-antitoxin system